MTSSHESNDIPGSQASVGTRRTFFQWVTRAAAGLIGLSLAVPLVGYVISPALKRREQPWTEVGGLDDLTPGAPKQLDYVVTAQDGYLETTMHKAIWAVKQPDAQVTVFSPMCTHLGCGYHWDVSDRKFKCPCHGSVFDIDGQVLAGPAPRHLDTLPTKTENGRIFVIYKEFKAGIAKPVAL